MKIGPLKSRDAIRITETEIKYVRKTAGYTWTDYKRNTEIAKELNITPVLDKIEEHRRNWLLHINRMPHNRVLKSKSKKNTDQKTEIIGGGH